MLEDKIIQIITTKEKDPEGILPERVDIYGLSENGNLYGLEYNHDDDESYWNLIVTSPRANKEDVEG